MHGPIRQLSFDQFDYLREGRPMTDSEMREREEVLGNNEYILKARADEFYAKHPEMRGEEYGY